LPYPSPFTGEGRPALSEVEGMRVTDETLSKSVLVRRKAIEDKGGWHREQTLAPYRARGFLFLPKEAHEPCIRKTSIGTSVRPENMLNSAPA